MISTYLAVAGANFLFIFLKAYQQRNVAFDNYGMVIPTSFGLALTEVYVIAKVAALGFTLPLALTIGAAAGSGALCAMLLHKRYHTKPTTTDTGDFEWDEDLLDWRPRKQASVPALRSMFTKMHFRKEPNLATNHQRRS
jgi:hypothetical protein